MSEEEVKKIIFKTFYENNEELKNQTKALKSIINNLYRYIEQYVFLADTNVETILFNIILLKSERKINQADLCSITINNIKLFSQKKVKEGFDFSKMLNN